MRVNIMGQEQQVWREEEEEERMMGTEGEAWCIQKSVILYGRGQFETCLLSV